ncbi:MAG: hypothetical protein IKS19_02210 [Clostridia bacterium]|nr:hypothetical protein [Clostridia bacterium]
MKKARKHIINILIAVLFVVVGALAICGFNMYQTTSVSLSLTDDKGAITSYTLDFAEKSAFSERYDPDGEYTRSDSIELSGGDVFRIKAAFSLSLMTFWSDRYGEDQIRWTLTRTRRDVSNISSGGDKKPVLYGLARDTIMGIFEEKG